jgi:REP element-mobilizing transposase RayT
MPRPPRLSTSGIAYHVLNRRVGRLELFDKPSDYLAFEKILAEADQRAGVRIAADCLMSNHWPLLLWPRADGKLSEVMRWITSPLPTLRTRHKHAAESDIRAAGKRLFRCGGWNILPDSWQTTSRTLGLSGLIRWTIN